MRNIDIITWNVMMHKKQVVFKKVQSNPFLVIKNVTLIFQNLKEYLFDPYLQNKDRNVFEVIEKWIL